MIEIKEVKTTEVMRKMQELYQQHWEEVANYKDQVPLDVDFDLLSRLDEAGKLIGVTAEEDGVAIGYALFIMAPHPHYKSLKTAANDVLFLQKNKRDTGTGLKLISESIRICKERGANKVTFHIKPDHDFSPLLKRFGFLHEEMIYGKLV